MWPCKSRYAQIFMQLQYSRVACCTEFYVWIIMLVDSYAAWVFCSYHIYVVCCAPWFLSTIYVYVLAIHQGFHAGYFTGGRGPRSMHGSFARSRSTEHFDVASKIAQSPFRVSRTFVTPPVVRCFCFFSFWWLFSFIPDFMAVLHHHHHPTTAMG